MEHSTLLKDGYIVLPDETVKGSIRIRGEVIEALGDIVPLDHEEIIDCSDCYFLPGGIETHTHLDLESMGTVTADDFRTGTLAALAGGTTTVLDFATQFHGESMVRGLERWHEKADGRSAIDYGFHMALTEWNDDLKSEMASIVADGITSFKMYMAYKGRMMVQEDEIYEALEEAGKLGATIGFHCENGLLIDLFTRRIREAGNLTPYYHQMTRPPELEAEAIDRLETVVSLLHTNHYVVHLSTARGLSSVLRARERGNDVIVETCPQYLLLDRSRYGTPEEHNFESAKFIMSPPLRERRDQEALWQGLASGDIQFVGTDHCSFNFKGQKEMGREDFSKIPNGAPGIELRMNLMYSCGVAGGRMDINRFSVVTSTNAAKYFGLFPRKGILQVGSDADIVVFDPKTEWTVTSDLLHENCDYTPYEGFSLKGKVRDVFLRGNRKVISGNVVVRDADGQYLRRGLPDVTIR